MGPELEQVGMGGGAGLLSKGLLLLSYAPVNDAEIKGAVGRDKGEE